MKTSVSKALKIVLLIASLGCHIALIFNINFYNYYQPLDYVYSSCFVALLVLTLILWAKNKIFFISVCATLGIFITSIIFAYILDALDIDAMIAILPAVIIMAPFQPLSDLMDSFVFPWAGTVVIILLYLIPLFAGKFMGKKKNKE